MSTTLTFLMCLVAMANFTFCMLFVSFLCLSNMLKLCEKFLK